VAQNRSIGNSSIVKVCSTCGAENLDDDSVCGVCQAELGVVKPADSRSWKKVPFHFMTGPLVSALALLWFWFVDGFVGLLLLMLGLLLVLLSLSSGPNDPPFGWRKVRWMMRRRNEDEREEKKP